MVCHSSCIKGGIFATICQITLMPMTLPRIRMPSKSWRASDNHESQQRKKEDPTCFPGTENSWSWLEFPSAFLFQWTFGWICSTVTFLDLYENRDYMRLYTGIPIRVSTHISTPSITVVVHVLFFATIPLLRLSLAPTTQRPPTDYCIITT